MAGPAIRAWELSRTLAGHGLDVVLAAAAPVPRQRLPFSVIEATRSSVTSAVTACDSVIVPGGAFNLLDFGQDLPPLVVDLYDPSVIEGLELYADLPQEERLEHWARDVEGLQAQLRAGDFFLCASQRQRHFWIGALAQMGRVNPLTYQEDPTLERLLAIVPFGLPDEPPAATGGGLRGRVAGIEPGDVVGVWGGGMWNWFDPQLLVRATAAAAGAVANLRIVFLGADNPNPSVPRMRAAAEARALAESLEVARRSVFFLPGWIPYADRAAHLLDADFGVTLHHSGIETDLAFRTRVLDYLWAGLPIMSTAGDALSDLVEREGAGITVPAGDLDAIEAALVRMAREEGERHVFAASSRRLAQGLRWSAVCAPLVEFCRSPRHAADAGLRLDAHRSQVWRRGLRALRQDGARRFAQRSYRYLRRRL